MNFHKVLLVGTFLVLSACGDDSSPGESDIPVEYQAQSYKQYQADNTTQSFDGLWFYVGTTTSNYVEISYFSGEKTTRARTTHRREFATFQEVQGANGLELHVYFCDSIYPEIYLVNGSAVSANEGVGYLTSGSVIGFNELSITKEIFYDQLSFYDGGYGKTVSRWLKINNDVNANIGSINHQLTKNGTVISTGQNLKCFYDDLMSGTSTFSDGSSISYTNRLLEFYDDLGGSIRLEEEESSDLVELSQWISISAPPFGVNGSYSEFNTVNTLQSFSLSADIDKFIYSLQNIDSSSNVVNSDATINLTF